jgi:hypothetical protein
MGDLRCLADSSALGGGLLSQHLQFRPNFFQPALPSVERSPGLAAVAAERLLPIKIVGVVNGVHLLMQRGNPRFPFGFGLHGALPSHRSRGEEV